MKTKNRFLSLLFIGAILLAGVVETSAQAKPFTTLTGTQDTVVSGVHTINMYCVNYNPSTELIAQIEIQAAAKVAAHDSIYGIGAIWGSVDGVSYIQLSQLDTYNTNFSDSLNVPTGTHGVAIAKSKMWTYDIHRTSQPLPRYLKLVWTNKQVALTDSTQVSGTLFGNP